MLRAARLAIACLVLAALVTQYAEGTQRSTFEPANFFSFFTVQANIFAAAVLLATVALGSRTDAWRGAATLYMAATGVVYTVLLSGLEDRLQTPIPWVNAVLHYITPVYMVADWLLDPPARPVPFRRAAWWLAFPLAYCAYSLLRGPLVDWYPYPFLDPREHGYGVVAVMCVAVAVTFAALAWLLARTTRRAAQARRAVTR